MIWQNLYPLIVKNVPMCEDCPRKANGKQYIYAGAMNMPAIEGEHPWVDVLFVFDRAQNHRSVIIKWFHELMREREPGLSYAIIGPTLCPCHDEDGHFTLPTDEHVRSCQPSLQKVFELVLPKAIAYCGPKAWTRAEFAFYVNDVKIPEIKLPHPARVIFSEDPIERCRHQDNYEEALAMLRRLVNSSEFSEIIDEMRAIREKAGS